MKDTITVTGNSLLAYFGATGVTKRITCIDLEGGFCFQLDDSRKCIQFVKAGAAPEMIEEFGTQELAETALYGVRGKVFGNARFRRGKNAGRAALWAFAIVLITVFVLSLNTIATALLMGETAGAVGTGHSSYAPSKKVELAADLARNLPPPAQQENPPKAELAAALEAGADSAKYSVTLSEGDGVSGTLYVFSDPSCPHCRRLERTLSTVTDKVKVVVFPVTVVGGQQSQRALDPVFCAEGSARREQWGNAVEGNATKATSECSGASDMALSANNEFFHAMGFLGTPSIVNGRGQVYPTNRAATAENLLAWAGGE